MRSDALAGSSSLSGSSVGRPSRFRRIWTAAKEDVACYGLAILSAGLLRSAFPRPGLWPIAWVALVPILMALRARSGWRAATIAWVFGAAFSYWNVSWLNTLIQFNPFIPLGIVVLGAAMGVWVALSGAGWSILRNRYGAIAGGILGAFWWSGTEWLRSLGPYGFPWSLLGISQQPSIGLIQITSITGVYGLTFLILLSNGFLAEGALAWMAMRELRRNRSVPLPAVAAVQSAARRALVAFSALMLLTVFLTGWGCHRAGSIERHFEEAAEAANTEMRVAVLQPGILQSIKWDSYAHPDPERREELQHLMMQDLLDRLDALAESGKEVDVVITPESAITTNYFALQADLQSLIAERARDLGAPILLGADDTTLYTKQGEVTTDLTLAVDPETGIPWSHDMYVAAWMIPPDRPVDPGAVYRKVRLVPFGEWVPWLNIIPGFQEHIVQVGSFTPGAGTVVFPISIRGDQWAPSRVEGDDTLDPALATLRGLTPPQVGLATSICFESVFSSLYRQMAKEGADVLVNITNDAWYGETSGPFQHFQIAVLRAVETGRPLIRCANTGITAIVSPAGRELEKLPFYQGGLLTSSVSVDPDPANTFYTRWGDVWSKGCLLISLIALLLGRMRFGRPSQGRE